MLRPELPISTPDGTLQLGQPGKPERPATQQPSKSVRSLVAAAPSVVRLVAVRVLLLSAVAALLLVVDPGALETTSGWLRLVLAGAAFALATYTAQTSPPRRAVLVWTWTTAAATVLLALPRVATANARLGPEPPLNQLRWTDLQIVIAELPNAVTLIGAPAGVGITSALLMRALARRRRTKAAPDTPAPPARQQQPPVRATHPVSNPTRATSQP